MNVNNENKKKCSQYSYLKHIVSLTIPVLSLNGFCFLSALCMCVIRRHLFADVLNNFPIYLFRLFNFSMSIFFLIVLLWLIKKLTKSSSGFKTLQSGKQYFLMNLFGVMLWFPSTSFYYKYYIGIETMNGMRIIVNILGDFVFGFVYICILPILLRKCEFPCTIRWRGLCSIHNIFLFSIYLIVCAFSLLLLFSAILEGVVYDVLFMMLFFYTIISIKASK